MNNRDNQEGPRKVYQYSWKYPEIVLFYFINIQTNTYSVLNIFTTYCRKGKVDYLQFFKFSD